MTMRRRATAALLVVGCAVGAVACSSSGDAEPSRSSRPGSPVTTAAAGSSSPAPAYPVGPTLSPALGDALKAAKSDAAALLSYRYDDLDALRSAARKRTTAEFGRTFLNTVDKTVAPAAKNAKAATKATVGPAGVRGVSGDSVGVLLFVDQKTITGSTRISTNPSAVYLTMQRVAGKYLVSELTPGQASSGPDERAGFAPLLADAVREAQQIEGMLLTISWKTATTSVAALSRRTTGAYAKSFPKSSASLIKSLKKSHASTAVGTVHSAVVSVHGADTVHLLTSATQTVRADGSATPRSRQRRIDCTVVLRHGRWLVSDLGYAS